MTQERATRTLDDIEKGNTRKSRRPIPTTHSFKLSKLKTRLAGIKVWGMDDAPRDDPRDTDLCLDCGEFNESHYVDEDSNEYRGHPFNPPGGPQDKAERIMRKQANPENKITKKDLKRR